MVTLTEGWTVSIISSRESFWVLMVWVDMAKDERELMEGMEETHEG
jgi:hypothetical protein